jgi:hypothetical protein
MPNLTRAAIMLAGVMVLSSIAVAGSSRTGPTYIGERSDNPEQETYGYVVMGESQRRLGFIGPARRVGAATGNAEKDTVAYRPLLEVERNALVSFWYEQE